MHGSVGRGVGGVGGSVGSVGGRGPPSTGRSRRSSGTLEFGDARGMTGPGESVDEVAKGGRGGGPAGLVGLHEAGPGGLGVPAVSHSRVVVYQRSSRSGDSRVVVVGEMEDEGRTK